MEKKRILIVDDEPDIIKILRIRLEKQGYTVLAAKTGMDGLKVARAKLPDLIILDLMLPDMDGLDVCRKIKEEPKTKSIAVLMLTAKRETSDEVIGLELGADDYVTKPFDFAVLHSRIKNLFRLYSGQSKAAGQIYKVGRLTVDATRQKALVDGKEILLTTIEFRILLFFVQNPGRVFSREKVIEGAWKEAVEINDRAVDVHINSIRSSLRPLADYVETVRGTGYRFKEID